MHEHLLWNITPLALREAVSDGPDPRQWWDLLNATATDTRNTTQRDRGVASRAVAEMVGHGGQTVVELTIGGLEPDPEGLAQVARETGTHIVMGCGHYVHDYQDPANAERTVDSFAQEMIAQVQDGALGTGVRAGIVGEIGCQWPWTELERRVLAGAVRGHIRVWLPRLLRRSRTGRVHHHEFADVLRSDQTEQPTLRINDAHCRKGTRLHHA